MCPGSTCIYLHVSYWHLKMDPFCLCRACTRLQKEGGRTPTSLHIGERQVRDHHPHPLRYHQGGYPELSAFSAWQSCHRMCHRHVPCYDLCRLAASERATGRGRFKRNCYGSCHIPATSIVAWTAQCLGRSSLFTLYWQTVFWNAAIRCLQQI